MNGECTAAPTPERAKKVQDWNDIWSAMTGVNQLILGYNKPVANNNKKETAMFIRDDLIDLELDPDSGKTNHLKNRLWAIEMEKENELLKAYGLKDDASPETVKDLVQRIKDGKYTVSKEYETKPSIYPAGLIRWRDPEMKEDPEGYETARKTLTKAYKDAEDEIVVLPPEKGLETLRAFQAMTFN